MCGGHVAHTTCIYVSYSLSNTDTAIIPVTFYVAYFLGPQREAFAISLKTLSLLRIIVYIRIRMYIYESLNVWRCLR